MSDVKELEKLAKLVRFYILDMTTRAGSGHPTSSLSAVEMMVALYFSKLRYDLKNPDNPNNDRVIISKGHAAPLLYALLGAAGALSEAELKTYRQKDSKLEGHPVPRFKYVDVATGSLGQGLSAGVGMALAAKLDTLDYLTYVLMGDSESAEGSVWEAMELASFYKLGNLVGILDVNRLGQSRPTMLEWDVDKYRARAEAFGWNTLEVDGHDLDEILRTYEILDGKGEKPTLIIAKTIKGKGISFLEDKVEWHGIALKEDEFKSALFELGNVNKKLVGSIKKPEAKDLDSKVRPFVSKRVDLKLSYKVGEKLATRKAYGDAIAEIGKSNQSIVVLDGETSNSTFAKVFREHVPERYLEMFIAEQNMVGTALGLATRGKIPFVSTFAVFFTRAFDQIRMCAVSEGNVKFVGSHGGVSIGPDGPSQMGLEDFSMFRSVFDSTVLCPADANATVKLTREMADSEGIFYMRTARPDTEVIYDTSEAFKIGGSKTLRKSGKDKVLVIACGLTLLEAIKAADELAKKGINIRVMDAYSLKPLDEVNIRKNSHEAGNLVITVEDHFAQGGLGDAVLEALSEDQIKLYKLAVKKMPASAKPEEQYTFEEIDSGAIIKKVQSVIKKSSNR